MPYPTIIDKVRVIRVMRVMRSLVYILNFSPLWLLWSKVWLKGMQASPLVYTVLPEGLFFVPEVNVAAGPTTEADVVECPLVMPGLVLVAGVVLAKVIFVVGLLLIKRLGVWLSVIDCWAVALDGLKNIVVSDWSTATAKIILSWVKLEDLQINLARRCRNKSAKSLVVIVVFMAILL